MKEDADVYQAEGMGLRNGRIWEMRLPIRPRYVRDLVALPVRGGVHLLGADGLTLGGASVNWVLEQLVPLLDGTRTFVELLAEVPDVVESSLLDVLHLMQMHGLLEEGEDDSTPEWRGEIAERFGPQLEFFSRYLRATGQCRNRYQAQRALSQARVSIVGDPDWTSLLARQLASSGVGEIFCQGSPPDGMEPQSIIWDSRGPAELSRIDLVVCIGSDLDQETTARECLARSYALLCLDPCSLSLGPLTHPRVSACPMCARSQLTLAETPLQSHTPAIHRLWSIALVSRAAQQVIGHLTGLFQPAVVGHVEVWSPHLGATTLQEVLRLPGCALCGDEVSPLTVAVPGGGMDNMALLYHRNVAIQPWHIQQPAGMQHHLSSDVQRLTRGAFLSHPWAERLRLPIPAEHENSTAGGSRPSESAPDVTPDLDTLSFLLHYSVGGSSTPTHDGGHHLKRHTASGGNLGSAEVYVVSTNVSGLAPGLYHYVLVDHSLERLRSGQFGDALADCTLEGPPDPARRLIRASTAVLVIVSAVQRLCRKYSERGYLYCLLDAGLVAHRLEALAARTSLHSRTIWEFDDERLADVLGVDGLNLAPTMVIALGQSTNGDADCEATPQWAS
jgi:SagB-type dehydrogenase family enzyme